MKFCSFTWWFVDWLTNHTAECPVIVNDDWLIAMDHDWLILAYYAIGVCEREKHREQGECLDQFTLVDYEKRNKYQIELAKNYLVY